MELGAAAIPSDGDTVKSVPGKKQAVHDPTDVVITVDGNVQRKGTVIGMALVSLLFAGLAARVLWHSGGPAPVVLRLSPVVCCCLFLWTVALTETTRARDVFLRVTYPALLGYGAAAEVDPVAGMVVAFAAGLLGHAVAEHRQRTGAERGAAVAAVLCNARWEDLTEEEETKEKRHRQYLAFNDAALSTIFSAACCLRAAWVALTYGEGDAELLLAELSVLACVCLAVWMVRVGRPMQEAFVWTVWVLAGSCTVLPFLPAAAIYSVVVHYHAEERYGVIGQLPIWLGALAMAALVGYLLDVRARYNRIIELARSDPATITADVVSSSSSNPLEQKLELVKLDRDNLGAPSVHAPA